MGNFLIVIIIAIAIGFLNFKYNFIGNFNINSVIPKSEVNNVVNEAVGAADTARKRQEEQIQEMNK